MNKSQARGATSRELLIEVFGKLENIEDRMDQQDASRGELKKSLEDHATKSAQRWDTIDQRTRFLEDDFNQRKGAKSNWPLIISIVSFISAIISILARA